MPSRITLIMLSATVDKAHEFAGWVGNIKQKMTHLIPTHHRVVPLEHYFYLPELDSPNPLLKVVTHNGTFQNFNEIKTVCKQTRPTKFLMDLLIF